MKLNKFFCALLMSVPGFAFAQGSSNTTNKPSGQNNKEVAIITSNPKQVPQKNATTTAPNSQTKEQSKVAKTDTIKKVSKITERSRKMTGDQYIPLAGEISYFGKNNDMVLNYTKNYYQNHFKHFATVRQRSTRYFKIIDKTFDRRDVPLEMKYLSVIESALNNKALSGVGALGPWQFMPSTGQFMGLVVNEKVDERTDWNKSTNAAAKYVNYLYDILQDWLLVVAAYNSGPRPVLAAMKKTGSSDFFVIKKYLPSETQNHVMAFIATATIMERMKSYIGAPVPKDFDWKLLNEKVIKDANGKIVPQKPKNPLTLRFTEDELKSMAIVKLNKPIDLDVLAREIEEDRRKMGRWNFDYYNQITEYNDGKSKDFLIRLPKDKLELFLQKKTFIEKQQINFDTE